MQTLTLPRFNDMHVHLRNRSVATDFAAISLQYCDHILAMPNTDPPLDTPDRWERYRDHLVDMGFSAERILVACKLTSQTTPEMIVEFARLGCRVAKLYPDGVTTNSESGLTSLKQLASVFDAMATRRMVLSIHGEDPTAFCLDRESRWLGKMDWLLVTFPQLRVVLEHITTADAVQFVVRYGEDGQASRLRATITAHHLDLTLDNVIGDKLEPKNFCKPVAKRPSDRSWLQQAATGDLPYFFLGSDSAPHSRDAKYNCGCAGCFTAPHLPELLATIFDRLGALDSLASFTSTRAAQFYDLPSPTGSITLHKQEVPNGLLQPRHVAGEDYELFRLPGRAPLTWMREAWVEEPELKLG